MNTASFEGRACESREAGARTARTNDDRLSGRRKVYNDMRDDLLFAFGSFAVTYAVIVLAAHGMAQGWW